MGQVSGIRFALTGATLIAISFGLARFAFGLFVPQIRADLEISANTIGVIAALPLISFVFISLVAPLVTKYFGARNTTVLSALFGVFGLALVSQATGSPIIGLLVGEFGYAESFSIFAAVGVFIALISPFYPGHTEHEGEVPEEEAGLQAAYDNQLQDEEGEPLESASTEP